MKPSCGPELVPVEVGRGGEEEVKVVERRVGLKRRDEGLTGTLSIRDDQIKNPQPYPSLPNETIVTQVFQHGFLSAAQVLCRVFLCSTDQNYNLLCMIEEFTLPNSMVESMKMNPKTSTKSICRS